jgi:hypothetical protein
MRIVLPAVMPVLAVVLYTVVNMYDLDEEAINELSKGLHNQSSVK